MTVDEIYSEVIAHMIKGLMVHDQLANYYDFLGLCGYKRCHQYHYLEESRSYQKMCSYVINHHNKLVQQLPVEDPKVIPDSWYRYTRQDVDNNTKKNAVRNGLNVWVDWERETKELYEKAYKELMDMNEIAGACRIKCLIKCVDHELKKAEKYQLNKKAVDYDLIYIIDEQHDMHCKYKEMMKHLYA